jgi:L-rhamnose-H+ transport protein
MWGIGGLTFGLSRRYLGLSPGMALSLGFCAVFGPLVPPVFEGCTAGLAAAASGRIVVLILSTFVVGVGNYIATLKEALGRAPPRTNV